MSIVYEEIEGQKDKKCNAISPVLTAGEGHGSNTIALSLLLVVSP